MNTPEKTPGQIAYEGFYETITENDPLAEDGDAPLSWEELCAYDHVYPLQWEAYAQALAAHARATDPVRRELVAFFERIQKELNRVREARVTLMWIESALAAYTTTTEKGKG